MSTKEFTFILLSALAMGYALGFTVSNSKSTEPTKQPTVKCTDDKLYDISYEGNITIYEKRPFTTCEER